MHYEAPDGIPNLRLLGDMRTEIVRRFYERAPFPDYPSRATLSWLRARAERSEFARLIDRAIPGNARVVEIGCGTGQMSLYLAHADRVVIGADLTRESLRLGVEAARRFDLDQIQLPHRENDRRRPQGHRDAVSGGGARRAPYADGLAWIFEQIADAIITLSAPGAAPQGLGATGNPAFCTFWTLTGLPALNLPLIDSAAGLPIGVQLVGASPARRGLAAHGARAHRPAGRGLRRPPRRAIPRPCVLTLYERKQHREKPLVLMELWCAALGSNREKTFRCVVCHSWAGAEPLYGRT